MNEQLQIDITLTTLTLTLTTTRKSSSGKYKGVEYKREVYVGKCQ